MPKTDSVEMERLYQEMKAFTRLHAPNINMVTATQHPRTPQYNPPPPPINSVVIIDYLSLL
jgi:hypothetical protein